MHPRRASAEHPRAALRPLYLRVLVFGILLIVAPTPGRAETECLVRVKPSRGRVVDGAVCAEAQNKGCVFQLQLCLNQGQAGCAPAPMKRKVKAHGSCGAIAKLQARPDGTNPVCGSVVAIKVKTKRKGKREGKCRLVVAARSTDRPARHQVERVTLVCKPNPGDCPPALTVGSPTTTTLPCLPACDCCVSPATDLLRCITR